MANNDSLRLAVLIDADNASAAIARELLEEIAKYGTPTIKRAYGDWTTPKATLIKSLSTDAVPIAFN